MGLILLITFVPFVALGFSIILGMRVYDSGRTGWVPIALCIVPPTTLVWIMLALQLMRTGWLSYNIFLAITLAAFFSVMAALLEVRRAEIFKAHMVSCFALNCLALGSIILYLNVNGYAR